MFLLYLLKFAFIKISNILGFLAIFSCGIAVLLYFKFSDLFFELIVFGLTFLKQLQKSLDFGGLRLDPEVYFLRQTLRVVFFDLMNEILFFLLQFINSFL